MKAPPCSTARLGALLGFLLLLASPARAQSFVELGGGWNYLATPPATNTYTNSFNVRASVGQPISPNFVVRFDATLIQFDRNFPIIAPCLPGVECNVAPGDELTDVVGLAVSGLVSLDQRGIFYLTGGAGLYDTRTSTGEVRLGFSGGAGIAVPLRKGLRAVVEARCFSLIDSSRAPSWFAPVTVGLRF